MIDDLIMEQTDIDKYLDDNCPKYLLKFVDSNFFDSTMSGYVHFQSISRYSDPVFGNLLTAAQADDGESGIRFSSKSEVHPETLMFVAPLSDPSSCHFVKPAIDPITGNYSYNYIEHETYRFPGIQAILNDITIGSYYALESSDIINRKGSVFLTDKCKNNLINSELHVTTNGANRSYVIYDFRLFFDAICRNISEFFNDLVERSFRFSAGMVSYYDNFNKETTSNYMNKIESLLQSDAPTNINMTKAIMYLLNNKQKKYKNQKEFRLSLWTNDINTEAIAISLFSQNSVKNDIKRSIVGSDSTLI